MQVSIEQLLLTHISKYPGIQPEDCIKLLYQRVYGGAHLGQNLADAEMYLRQELSLDDPRLQEAAKAPEPLSGALCRVHLSVPVHKYSAKTLAALFIAGAAQTQGDEQALSDALQVLRVLAEAGRLPFSAQEVGEAISAFERSGRRQPHHSERYKALYAPHYRIFTRDIALYLSVFYAIDRALAQRPHVFVGIDGMSGAGKSLLAALLRRVYSCGIIHADDFFLQQHQRTPARLAEAGGNIDYERLAQTVKQAEKGVSFTYAAYRCDTQTMAETRQVPKTRLTVLEGVYAHHPKLAADYDVRIFLGTDAQIQAQRILRRSGPQLAQRFYREWIPMENRYFSEYNIRNNADVVVDTSEI